MNIINKLIYNFAEYKTCLFCNSKLEPNKVEKILHLTFYPHYCNNCTIDYSNYNDGMLRIYHKTFTFSIDMHNRLGVWSNDSTRICSRPIPNALNKEELYSDFDKIIKEYIFQ